MPYIRPDKVSSVCLVRNRYRGSGFTLNGFSFNPKNLLYIVSISSRRAHDDYLSYPVSLHYQAQTQEDLVLCIVRPAIRAVAEGRVGDLNLCLISKRKVHRAT